MRQPNGKVQIETEAGQAVDGANGATNTYIVCPARFAWLLSLERKCGQMPRKRERETGRERERGAEPVPVCMQRELLNFSLIRVFICVCVLCQLITNMVAPPAPLLYATDSPFSVCQFFALLVCFPPCFFFPSSPLRTGSRRCSSR